MTERDGADVAIGRDGNADGITRRKGGGLVDLRRRMRMILVGVVALFWAAAPASAAEYYFLLVFGSESHPKLLRYTHTWATFVRAVGEGPNLSDYTLYAHTISWLPRTLEVRVWKPAPEPGVNLDLYQTLQTVYATNQDVTMWGPFVTMPDIYQNSLRVKQFLESGQMQYRAIDGGANALIDDCIHAVSAVDQVFGKRHYPLIRVGKPASRFIAREIMVRSIEERHIDQANFDASWLIPRLGLDRYPIEVVPPRQIPPQRCVFCRCPD
jgi:hypothetical protein